MLMNFSLEIVPIFKLQTKSWPCTSNVLMAWLSEAKSVVGHL